MVAFVHTFKNQPISAHCETTLERGRGDSCFPALFVETKAGGRCAGLCLVVDDRRGYAFLSPGTEFVNCTL